MNNITPFDRLAAQLSHLKLDDAILYLNYVLQASQDLNLNEIIYQFAQKHIGAITDFKVEFLAKWLIIKTSFTSPEILSPAALDWESFLQLSERYNQIDDPIVNDPTFQSRNPVDLFIRMAHQQLLGQQRIMLQAFGSAYLLFQSAGARIADQINYNIPERFQELTGLTLEEFIQLGIVFLTANAGPEKTRGTVSREYLRKGYSQGLTILTDNNIERFLNIASANYQKFRDEANKEIYHVKDMAFILYEFNPLKKYPLIQIHPDRWVAPNPDLIVDRITTGVFYDLLDADSTRFTQKFGLVFQEYIGDLLRSVYSPNHVHSEKTYGYKQHKKQGPADWSVTERDAVILFECKSLIPNLDFVSISSQADIEVYSERIAGAIEQMYKGIQAIQSEEPGLEEFAALNPKVVVLTMGRIQMVNTPFFKKAINWILENKGIHNLSYVVLSLQELELLLSLVERSISLVEILTRFENEPLGKIFEPYKDLLSQSALPSIVIEQGKKIINFHRELSV